MCVRSSHALLASLFCGYIGSFVKDDYDETIHTHLCRKLFLYFDMFTEERERRTSLKLINLSHIALTKIQLLRTERISQCRSNWERSTRRSSRVTSQTNFLTIFWSQLRSEENVSFATQLLIISERIEISSFLHTSSETITAFVWI